MFIVVIDTMIQKRKHVKHYLFICLFCLESQHEGVYWNFNLLIIVVSILSLVFLNFLECEYPIDPLTMPLQGVANGPSKILGLEKF